MKLWLIVIQDKSISGEPDVGMAFHDGSGDEANALASEMEAAMTAFGRSRCVSRVRSVETGRQYRVGSLVQVSHCSL